MTQEKRGQHTTLHVGLRPSCGSVTLGRGAAVVDGDSGWLASEVYIWTRRHDGENHMKAVVELLNEMKKAGVVQDYALFGAVAQMRYTEPIATLDADILVLLKDATAIDVLSQIYRFCRERGYLPREEAVLVGDWPVQFIPTFSPLTEEAVREAETGEIEGLSVRVVSARHLAAIALSVGRARDHARILALLESEAVNRDEIERVALRHGLQERWTNFKRRFLDE